METSKQKLSIAFICDPIGENKSGVVVSTLRFGKLLRERGNHVIFIGARLKEHPDHSEHHGIKAYRFRSLPVPKGGGWHLAFPSVNELKKIFRDEKTDIVHIILPMSGAIVAIKAAKALGTKIVAHSHSQPENLFMEMPKLIQPILNNMWNKYLVWTYSKAETLIYPSELAKTLLHKLGNPDQPSAVISNGINLAEFPQVHLGDFYGRFKIPEDKVHLLFVGRLYPEKSIDTLIRAMPHIIEGNKKVHLMIVGEGHLRPKLEKLMKDLNMTPHITFLGLVSDEDRLLAYHACDIFILPSLAELEGMVVLEAMACGKPVIVADAEMSASRFFVSGNGFLFKTKNPEDLAEKALKLINDPELRIRMGRASLEKVQKYDIHHSVEMLEKVYYSALKNPQ